MKYLTYILSFCFLIIGSTMQAQTNKSAHLKSDLNQQWVLKKGWFGEAEIVFEIKDLAIHTDGLFRVFAFEKENIINYQLFNPQKFGMCGNGMLFINESTWETKADNQLRISLNGGRFLEDRFRYVADYAITEISGKSLKLNLIEEIKNEKTAYN